MTGEMHPQVVEALRHAQDFQSALEDQMHRADTESYTATDGAKSVEVTLSGQRCLTALYIEDGLLRQGADTVAQRINEALMNAQDAATAAIDAEHDKLLAALADIAGSLKATLGLI